MLGFLVNTVIAGAIFYNIHHSFKNTLKEQKRFYKHYFMVMAFLLSLDGAFAFLLRYIPYYQIFKLLLFVWLSVPMSTGSHFMYSVYIKNIHKLFEGDIDSVISNMRMYVEQVKAKYYEMVNSSRRVEVGFKSGKTGEEKRQETVESSDVEMSNSAVCDAVEELEEEVEDKDEH